MSNNPNYFCYLLRRSLIGLAYRRLFLYPRVSTFCKGNVLDVGCGLGDFLAHQKRSVGVDVNPAAVAYCKSKGLDSRLMIHDVLPFPSESFSTIVLDNVIEHITCPDALLREIFRVLRPGGKFVVGIPGAAGFESDPDHKVFYEESTLIRTVELEKFQCVDSFHTPVKLLLLSRILRACSIYCVFNK